MSERFGLLLNAFEARKRDERDELPARQRTQALHELEPVHIGQDQILKHQVGGLRAHLGDRGRAVLRLDDTVSLDLERDFHHFARGGIVLDEEDSGRFHGCCPARYCATATGSLSTSMGLVMYPSHPAARAFSSSPFMA